MKVFLDAPEGWVRAYWPEEAIEFLKTGEVEIISLDHDLGDDKRDGYLVLKWIEEETALNGFIPPEMIVHSDNTPAADRMRQAIKRIEKFVREGV